MIEAGADGCKPPPPTDCKCQDSNDVCGSVYPANCALKASTLHTCAGDGSTPQPGTKCPSGCFVHLNKADECRNGPLPEECKCKDSSTHCGSSFPPTCGYEPNTLYKCDAGAETTLITGEKCTTGCSIETGADACLPPAPTDCKCVDDQAICGNAFDENCKFDKDTLFTCSAARADPSLVLSAARAAITRRVLTSARRTTASAHRRDVSVLE